MYFMPFLDFRIVLRFEVVGTWPWTITSAKAPMECRVRHWPHQCRNNLLLWSPYWRISSISKDFKQKLNNCFTVRELFPIGRMAISTFQSIWLFFYAAGVRSRCKILQNFLFMFVSHRTPGLYYFHLKSSRSVLNKIKLISDVYIKNSNNDMDLKDHWPRASTDFVGLLDELEYS